MPDEAGRRGRQTKQRPQMDRVNALQRTGQKQRQISGGDDIAEARQTVNHQESPRRATVSLPDAGREVSTWEALTSAAGGVSSQRIASASSRPAHNAQSSQICWLVRLRACPRAILRGDKYPQPHPGIQQRRPVMMPHMFQQPQRTCNQRYRAQRAGDGAQRNNGPRRAHPGQQRRGWRWSTRRR